MRASNLIVISFVLILIILGIFRMNPQDHRTFRFASASMPYSADPIDYDSYIHHYAFTSVLGTLVSSSQKGKITPQIAEKWSHDRDSKVWTFTIRENLKYSNGDLITARDYELSLKRMVYLQKMSNSQSGVLENLLDFDKITDLKNISSIESKNNNLIMTFKVPMTDLLTKISFGFYSLAHPSLYNREDGKWINKKQVISSGPYEVKKWDDNNYEMLLRKNISYVDYESAIENVIFADLSAIKEKKDLADIDMVVADKSTLMVDDSFEYIGSSEGFKINYVECYGWNDAKGPMHHIGIRKWLRSKFMEGLQKSKFEITNSFFPTIFPGIKKFPLDIQAPLPGNAKFDLITHTMNKSSKIRENSSKMSIQEIFDQSLKNLSSGSEIKVRQIDYSDSMDIEKELHLAINGTGIEADEFIDTVRFMFLSKQGINLPDANGTILAELNKSEPDVDFINKQIWDQVIIWPIRHYTKGYWFKKNSLVDYEKLDLDLPSIDFQFIKWK